MAKDLPYLTSYKNVSRLFDGIAAAKQPESFTHQFLRETLGLKGTGDRPLIPLLRSLGFIDGANRPTAAYGELKNTGKRKTAIANGIRTAYLPLFTANENADKLPPDDLKGLVAQIAGSDEGMTSKIVGTLNALKQQADFTPKQQAGFAPQQVDGPKSEDRNEALERNEKPLLDRPNGRGVEPQFHYNIQVQLPANGTEETYLNIFSALRKVFPS